MLWGTGRTDREGYPLLEIRHLGKTPSFSEGQVVLTEGGDGLYPAGCIVGHIREMPGQKDSLAIVRSDVLIDSLRRVVLLEDLARKDLARLREGPR